MFYQENLTGVGIVLLGLAQRWDLKDYFSRHSDLGRREKWFLGLTSA